MSKSKTVVYIIYKGKKYKLRNRVKNSPINPRYEDYLGTVWVEYVKIFVSKRKSCFIASPTKPRKIAWRKQFSTEHGLYLDYFPVTSEMSPFRIYQPVISRYCSIALLESFLRLYKRLVPDATYNYWMENSFPFYKLQAEDYAEWLRQRVIQHKLIRDARRKAKYEKLLQPGQFAFNHRSFREITNVLSETVTGYFPYEFSDVTVVPVLASSLEGSTWRAIKVVPDCYQEEHHYNFISLQQAESYTEFSYQMSLLGEFASGYQRREVYGFRDYPDFAFSGLGNSDGSPFGYFGKKPYPLYEVTASELFDKARFLALKKLSRKFKQQNANSSNFSITVGETLLLAPVALSYAKKRGISHLFEDLYTRMRVSFSAFCQFVWKNRFTYVNRTRLYDYKTNTMKYFEHGFTPVIGFELSLVEMLLSTDLCYKFAIKPLINDFYNLVALSEFGIENLPESIDKDRVLSSSNRKARLRVKKFAIHEGKLGVESEDFFADYLDMSVDFSLNYCSLTSGVGYRVLATMQDEATYNISHFASLDPRKVAWELFPLSFIINWFIDIGGFIEGRSLKRYNQGYVISDIWETTSSIEAVNYRCTQTHTSTDPDVAYSSSRKDREKIKSVNSVRKSLNEIPDMPIPTWDPEQGFSSFKRQKITSIVEILTLFAINPFRVFFKTGSFILK